MSVFRRKGASGGSNDAGPPAPRTSLTIKGESYPLRGDFEAFSRDAAAGKLALLRTTIDAPVKEIATRLSDALSDAFGRYAPQTRATTEMTLHCLHCSMGYPLKYVQLRDDFRDGTLSDYIEPGGTPDATKRFEKILQMMRMSVCIECGGSNAALLYDPSRQAEGGDGHADAARDQRTYVVDGAQGGDYPTIAEAVGAAAPGDRILVRAGVYAESVVLDKPLELIGDGSSGDVVIESSGAPAVLFQADSGRVANFALREVGDNSDIRTVRITQGRLTLQDCDVTSRTGCCVAIEKAADPQLNRNRIHDGGQAGVYVFKNGLGTLEDNEIYNNAWTGVTVVGGNSTIRRNRIRDNEESGVFVLDHALGVVEDNDITGNAKAGVSIKTGGNPTVRGNRIRDNEQSGVYVYNEGVGVVENNDITGNSYDGVAVTNGGNPTVRGNRIRDSKVTGIYIFDRGTGVIEGNDISGPSPGVAIKTGGNPTVRGNRIHGSERSGVVVYDQGLGVFEDNEIAGNAVAGVMIRLGGNPTVRGNRIRDNKNSGVYVYDQGLGVIEGNDITGSASPGVVTRTGGNPTVRGNRIHDGGRAGVIVYDEGLGVFEDNEIIGNANAGVVIRTGGNPTVRGNTISRNGQSAIYINDKGRGTITGNRMHGNAGGAWRIDPECEPNVVRQDNETSEPAARTSNVVVIPSTTGFVRGEPVNPRTPEVDSLIDELIQIGNGRGFITVKSNDARTREIGQRLHEIAGKRLMQQVHWEVSQEVRGSPRELEVAWHRVGDWLG